MRCANYSFTCHPGKLQDNVGNIVWPTRFLVFKIFENTVNFIGIRQKWLTRSYSRRRKSIDNRLYYYIESSVTHFTVSYSFATMFALSTALLLREPSLAFGAGTGLLLVFYVYLNDAQSNLDYFFIYSIKNLY